MLAPKLGSTVAVITLAVLWRNYWALVAGSVTGGILNLALSYAMHPYRPRLCLAKTREILFFSKWLLFNNVLLFLYARMDIFFLGKLAGVRASGLYSVAYEISNLPTTELVAPVRRAIYPGYARIADDAEAMRKGYIDVLALTLCLALPIAAGIGLVAGPLVLVFLGASWIEAIPLIQILAVYGVISLSWANMGPLLVAIGRPRALTVFTVVAVAVALPLLYFGVPAYGAIGAACAVTISNLVMLVIGLVVVLRAIGLPVRRLLDTVWRPLAAAGLMTAVVLPLRMGWPAEDGFAANLIELMTCSAVGAAVYVGALLGLWGLCRRPEGPERIILSTMRALWLRSMPSFGTR
jgi:O-antigen/teichoic acid export membrane protein